MAKVSVEDFVESLGSWTVLDLVKAKEAIEEKYGITAAAPMAVAAAAAPAAGEAVAASVGQLLALAVAVAGKLFPGRRSPARRPRRWPRSSRRLAPQLKSSSACDAP